METVTLAKQKREKQGQQVTLPRQERKMQGQLVTLAKQERKEQGQQVTLARQGMWEVEVSYGGEADLHRQHEACEKNPGHQNFIPVDQFNVEHLPPGYHDNDVVDWVRAVSDLTVRVLVPCVSESRPGTVSGSDKPYPCYSSMGRDMMSVGTGWVSDVRKTLDDSSSDITCKCKECVNSVNPRRQFARITIHTSAHVVHDQLEAAHTTCHLFFDRGGTPDLCHGVVTLSGMSGVRSVRRDKKNDTCEMTYDTHDLDLADMLSRMVSTWRGLYEKLCGRYDSVRSRPATDPCNLPTIIVSHPHGCSKQVSVGRCSSTMRKVEAGYEFTYTTATCPGSSGAPVFVLGARNRWSRLVNHHRGNCPWNRDFNFCGQSLYPYVAPPVSKC